MEKTIARFQASTDEDLRWQLQFNGLDLSGRTLAVHVRERGSNALKVKLTIGSGLTLIGTGNLNARVARSTMLGWARTEYETDVVDETGGDATTILAVRVVYDHPGNLPYGVRGNQATVQWGGNQAVVTAIGGVGPRGPAGPPNVITIGDVFTLETGELAAAVLTGEAPAQALNLWLPKGNTGSQGLQGIQGLQGLQGLRGWTPLLAVVPHGVREVLQVMDWTGGEGTKPATGLYVGDAGLVPDIANARNIRGAQGPSGSVEDGDKGDIVVSEAGTAWTIDSAYTAQWMPKTGGLFTDQVGISMIWPHFTLNKAASGEGNVIAGRMGGDLRWQMRIGSDHPEAGANTGSDFDIVRFDDAGEYLGIALTLKRNTGQLLLASRPSWGATPFDTDNLGAFAGDDGEGGIWGLVPAPAVGDATKFLSGAGTWVAGLKQGVVSAKSGAYAVAPGDLANSIVATGTWTLSLPPAASVGNGFFVKLRNAGAGVITIDPNGAETINGVASLGAYRGDSVELVCDGTAWHAFFRDSVAVISSATLSSSLATIDLSLPAEFRMFALELAGFEPTVSASLGLRASIDGGATFLAAVDTYPWWGGYNSSTTTYATTYKYSSSPTFTSTAIELFAGLQTAASGAFSQASIEIEAGGSGRYPGFDFSSGTASSQFQGSGWVASLNRMNAVRLLYSAGSIAAGAYYELTARRAA